MFIIDDYQTAVIFCVITMLCRGSWASTQKMARKKASRDQKSVSFKGIVISLVAGILVSFFYRFIAGSIDLEDFHNYAGQ